MNNHSNKSEPNEDIATLLQPVAVDQKKSQDDDGTDSRKGKGKMAAKKVVDDFFTIKHPLVVFLLEFLTDTYQSSDQVSEREWKELQSDLKAEGVKVTVAQLKRRAMEVFDHAGKDKPRETGTLTPNTKDFEFGVDVGPPEKVSYTIARIVRNTEKGDKLKELYNCKCQLCNYRICVPRKWAGFYTEVHHVRPLGGDHKGLDNWDNMLVLCPNCHAEFDALSIAIDPKTKLIVSYGQHKQSGKVIRFKKGHSLALNNIEHNWKRFVEAKSSI